MLSTIVHWISKLDPNAVVPVLGVAAAWLWHKVSGDTKKSAKTVIDLVIDNIAHEIDVAHETFGAPAYDVPLFLKRAREYLETRVWTALGKRGIRKSAGAERLVHQSTERATLWLVEEFKRRVPKP